MLRTGTIPIEYSKYVAYANDRITRFKAELARLPETEMKQRAYLKKMILNYKNRAERKLHKKNVIKGIEESDRMIKMTFRIVKDVVRRD